MLFQPVYIKSNTKHAQTPQNQSCFAVKGLCIHLDRIEGELGGVWLLDKVIC